MKNIINRFNYKKVKLKSFHFNIKNFVKLDFAIIVYFTIMLR